MRRHAKAVTAGSSKGHRADGSGRFITGARAAVLACLLAGLLATLAPAAATAAITHNPEPFSPLTGSGSGLTLSEPQGVAVDEATGNVFVSDENRVAILGAEGGAPVGLASPFEIPGISFGNNSTAGLAYDNSATSPARGTLYANDPGTHSIKKYTRDPTSEKYEPAGEIANLFLGGLSVDTAGDLYVSNGSMIYKYSPSGTLLAEYDLSETSIGAEGEQVAADNAGDLFVSGRNRGLYKFPANGSGEIDLDVYSQITNQEALGVTIDPASDEVYAALTNRVAEYDGASASKISEFASEEIKRTGRIAVNSATGRIYVADTSTITGGNAVVNVFGPAVTVPTTGIGAATNVTGSKATLNGSVNPEGIAVEECFFEWGQDLNGKANYEHEAECEALPPTDSASHPVSANISGLIANGKAYHFRLVAENENGTGKSADKTFVTANTVATEAATAVGAKAATLNGALRPEGLQFTTCAFEYGLASSAGFEEEVQCIPPAASVDADFLLHPVSAALAKLKSNATYKFRLTATNSEGTLSGEVLTFTTQGPPQISQLRASFADQSSATLEAKINPSGFGTSYRFEWGPTASYGNSVPAEFEPFVGSGEVPVQVRAKISGLSAGTIYHYRVVATNSIGTAESPDQILETLNSCGLPEGRCFEMVSPRNAGPVAIPGQPAAAAELHFQAAPDPGSTIYVVEAGFPDSTKGAEVLYHGTRRPSGWSSTQFAPPMSVRSETNSVDSASVVTEGLSEDLSCGVLTSNQPLTDDASTRFVSEAGGSNLYRRNPDGSYTAITKLAPESIEVPLNGELPVLGGEYAVAGFSGDCRKVVFSNELYRYPGVTGAGKNRLYEWDEGALRNLGVVPGPSGEVAVPAIPGFEFGAKENHANVVSEDGTRVFFSAKRQTSPNPSEIGTTGIFVREDGTVTRDLSLSETSTPDEGAIYQYATKDGSRVFFTANAGLTDESSPAGTDLYEYNLESEDLTDLSARDEAGGAQVAGFVGASEDGSHVYFVARGQLVPGKGKTLSQNQSDQTYSIYGAVDGVISYVGAAREEDVTSGGLTIEMQASWSSRVTSDGRYLLFESSANVTGYETAGDNSKEVYLYDAEASVPTVCISCRQDGYISTAKPLVTMLASGGPENQLYAPRTLIDIDGEPHVYFFSRERLAQGGAEGRVTLYEWSHGQVFAIATEPAGLTEEDATFPSPMIFFADASAEGTDIYFSTPQRMTWEDSDDRYSVYSARIGGGFPEPSAPPAPCEPNSEGSCQGLSGQPPAIPGAASTTFTGPGNLKPKKAQKHRKKHHKTKKHQKQSKQKKRANGNRRAGK